MTGAPLSSRGRIERDPPLPFAGVEHVQRETNAKLDALIAHLGVAYAAPQTDVEPELHETDPDSPTKAARKELPQEPPSRAGSPVNV